MDSLCSHTSSYKLKLVFMCSGCSTSPAMRLFLPFAASNWRAAHHCKPLWCALAQPFSCPRVNQDPHFPILSAPQVLLQEHMTAKQLPPEVFMGINKFHRTTGEPETETPSIPPSKTVKGGTRMKKKKNSKPEKAMKTSILLHLYAVPFPSKYLFTACKPQYRQQLLQQLTSSNYPTSPVSPLWSAALPASHANPLKSPAVWKCTEQVGIILAPAFMSRNQKGKQILSPTLSAHGKVKVICALRC